jgi:hypothetical protein
MQLFFMDKYTKMIAGIRRSYIPIQMWVTPNLAYELERGKEIVAVVGCCHTNKVGFTQIPHPKWLAEWFFTNF